MGADGREISSLPRPLRSFIGREDVLAELSGLLERHRLLTLTGPGGSGKTRLGIELARRVSADYPDGVYFVPLAVVRDPVLVPSSIARSLGLPDFSDRPPEDHLASYLGDRGALLVLDNVEQVVSGTAFLADLLAATTRVRIVVTSRSPLHLTGEQQFPVPPLPVPAVEDADLPASLAGCESASLFLARARAVSPDFSIDPTNAAAVVGIVRRLEGMPLAIELAAARIKVLPPQGILERLDHSLSLLSGGTQDVPDRQRTLRSTIAWSYDLLSVGARDVLAVAAAFEGGCALSDLESVAAAAVRLGAPVLDSLQELLDQSLLRLSSLGGQPRYLMLETVREFAAERLAERPDAEGIHSAHAAVFLGLVVRIERPPCWPDNAYLAVVDREQDNVRAALDWLSEHDPPVALSAAARLTAYWSMRGHFSEGRRRLRELLDRVVEENGVRVAALNGAGWLALDQGDLSLSLDLLSESIRVARAIGDRIGEGTALLNRGRTGLGAWGTERGGRDLEDALAVLSDAGDLPGIAAALMFNGLARMVSDDAGGAAARFAECISRCDQLGLTTLSARARQLLGLARLQDGDVPGAATALAEGVPVVVESGDRFGIAVGVAALAALAARTDRPRLALRLIGVLDEYAQVHQVAPPQPLVELVDRFLVPIRAAAGAAAETLRAQGRQWPLHTAVAAALSGQGEHTWRTGSGPALTRRESEVAELVATGLTNREVAARLYLSVRTVDVHVDRILTKLGFRNRSQLTAWAHDQGLATGDTYPR